jgi:hypothetical protein
MAPNTDSPFSDETSFEPHQDLQRLKELYPYIEDYQELANRHNIRDIFQDNGGKLLQVLLLLGLENVSDRIGNDAVDRHGNEYELKSVNLDRQSPSFTTHHHMTLEILNKYRQVDWIFATYNGIQIGEIYYSPPERLEKRYFQGWEEKLRKRYQNPEKDNHINNPKIAISHVRNVGNKLYPGGGQVEISF